MRQAWRTSKKVWNASKNSARRSRNNFFLLALAEMAERPIIIATRGSALALAQANFVAMECRKIFSRLRFEIKIIKTTGDKLATASLAKVGDKLPKGLFTKELEVALLKNHADIAVHSLKDLPTEIPAGLILAATPKRENVRDVLIYRDADFIKTRAPEKSEDWSPGQKDLRGFKSNLQLSDLPRGATVATGSVRRKVQLLAMRPDLKIAEIRGNVPTRLQKISEREEMDAIVLALAGLSRLNFQIT